MSTRPYSKLLNFAWYQLLWFTAVLGGSATQGFLLPLLILHLAMVGNWRRELTLMLGAATLGATCDALLTTAGYFVFADTAYGLPIPLWLVAIWMGFAGTLRHSMTFMVSRPRLFTMAAGLFAPMTYLAAQRLGAVSFPLGNGPTAIVIGLTWVTLTPVLVWLSAQTEGTFLRFAHDTPIPRELQP